MRGEAVPEGVGCDLNPMFRAQFGQRLLDAPCPHAPAVIAAFADEQGAVPSQLVGTGIQICASTRTAARPEVERGRFRTLRARRRYGRRRRRARGGLLAAPARWRRMVARWNRQEGQHALHQMRPPGARRTGKVIPPRPHAPIRPIQPIQRIRPQVFQVVEMKSSSSWALRSKHRKS